MKFYNATRRKTHPRRKLSIKRFTGEDMARFARYLTNMDRYQSICKLTDWFDGPPESGRGHTTWI